MRMCSVLRITSSKVSIQKHHLVQGHNTENEVRGTKDKRWREATGRKEIASHFLKKSVARTKAACAR